MTMPAREWIVRIRQDLRKLEAASGDPVMETRYRLFLRTKLRRVRVLYRRGGLTDKQEQVLAELVAKYLELLRG